MRCPGCSNDVKKKDRPDGKCPTCHRKFVFDPLSGDALTDVGFQHALERISSQGKVRWHPEHLYAELRRRTRRDTWPLVMIGLVLGGGMTAVAVFLVAAALFVRTAGIFVPMVMMSAGFAFAVAMVAQIFSRPGMDREVARGLLQRWRDAKQPLLGMIEPAARPVALSPELLDELEHYSFDRAVVTDQNWVVDTLVANNFHFENNCAVIGAAGYPKETFAILRKMVRLNPKIQVFVLHDATPEGCALAARLRDDPHWFQGIGTVVDVGLRPAHAKFFRGLEEPAAGGEGGTGITTAEQRWLAKYRLSLGVVRPEQLVKRLFRGITAVEAGAGGDGVIYLGVDADTADGGGDSFG